MSEDLNNTNNVSVEDTQPLPQPTQEYSMENDPLFKPISEEKKKKIDDAVEKQIRSLSLDENVDKDSEKLSGQNYALISVVSPQSSQKSENICLKIKGVFNTLLILSISSCVNSSICR